MTYSVELMCWSAEPASRFYTDRFLQLRGHTGQSSFFECGTNNLKVRGNTHM